MRSLGVNLGMLKAVYRAINGVLLWFSGLYLVRLSLLRYVSRDRCLRLLAGVSHRLAWVRRASVGDRLVSAPSW